MTADSELSAVKLFLAREDDTYIPTLVLHLMTCRPPNGCNCPINHRQMIHLATTNLEEARRRCREFNLRSGVPFDG